ncbi:NUDIX hydrolase [Dyella flava]|uniref:Phosphatase NudJ n=1 Tax=Dyella flava TaxID=1920170 RepID=A0ABS2KA35_9GAMM|nr:NUDIX hydrolase [Dyella flava]MBM7127819.1 NUDIX hydrolase [Dyella flava]GLQ51422.1 NUDIX hydrolase [Dyella flava]
MTEADSSRNDVWRPHVTVACVVADGHRYLMVEEEVNGRIAYNQPAGHLDDFESLQQAAVRETREETGWTVELTHLIGVHQWRSEEHGDVVVRFSFAARPLTHDPQQPLDTGICRPLWLTRGEIAELGPRLRSPMVLMSIDDWLAGQRLPLSVVANLMPGGGRS